MQYWGNFYPNEFWGLDQYWGTLSFTPVSTHIFLVDKNKPYASPIVLVEFDTFILIPEFINYEAGVWQSYISPGVITVTDDYGVVGYYRNTNEHRYNVQSFCVGSEFFTKVSSLANLRLQNKSFYYDVITTRVWFHFDTWEYPVNDGSRVDLGAAEGYCNRPDPLRPKDHSYYVDLYYEPRIKSIPNIQRSKDPLRYGVISFEGGTISFNNEDGYFDNFAARELFGNPVRILMGFEGYEYTDMRQVFSGYIQDFSLDFEEFKLQVKDPRKKLSNKLPTRKLTVALYPNLAEKNVDKYIPIAYGKVRNAPVVCVNELDGAGPYYFYFMDTTYHPATSLDIVRVDDLPIVPTATDLANGWFTLTAAQCMDGTTLKEVTADFHGADVGKGLDVVKDLFAHYADMAYITDNFNITEYDAAIPFDKDVGLYIVDRTDFIEAVQRVAVAIDAMIYPQDDGLYTARIFNLSRLVSKIIQSDDWIEDPSYVYDSDKFLSSCEIQYDQDYKTNEYKSYINTANEAAAYREYKTYKEEKFPCILTELADAQVKSEAIMSRSKDIYQEVTRSSRVQHFDLDIMDFVIAEHSRLDVDPKPWKLYEVEKINKKIDSNEIELEMGEISDLRQAYIDDPVATVPASSAGHAVLSPLDISVTPGTFEAIIAAEQNQWVSIAYGAGVFVAIANSGTHRVMRSTDYGTTWTAIHSIEDNTWKSITYGGGVFVAVSTDGAHRVMRSVDYGVTWAAIDAAEANPWASVAYGGGIFVAVNDSAITFEVMYSNDLGLTWTGISTTYQGWNSICYGDDKFVAVSYAAVDDYQIMYSTNGIDWTYVMAPADDEWWSVCYGDGVFVATSYYGNPYHIMYSTDGALTWHIVFVPQENHWISVCYGDGLFVAIASNGTNRVMYSYDKGLTWVLASAVEASAWYGVMYGNGFFIAVAFDGTSRVMRMKFYYYLT